MTESLQGFAPTLQQIDSWKALLMCFCLRETSADYLPSTMCGQTVLL